MAYKKHKSDLNLIKKIRKAVKDKHKFIFTIFLLIILIKPTLVIYQQKEQLLAPGYEKQYENLKKLYYSSQYAQKKNPIIIPDETFNSFAGGIFLKGLNPILIVHDHPPLGRYMIAASILIFDNPRTLMIPILFLAILGLYLLSKQVIRNPIIALIPVGMFINEPLLLNKLVYTPLIEPIQFPFILFAFYFFIRALKEKKYTKWFILTSIFLGIIISMRFFITGAIMTLCMILYLLYEERRIDKKFLFFIFTLPLSLVVLILSYTRAMMVGYSIIDVFKIQKYILAYHKSKFILPFSFWDLLLFNKWHTWWGSWEITFDRQWLISWPVSTILTAIYFLLSLFKRVNLSSVEKLFIFWLIIYCLTLSTGYSSTNYFLPIIPFFYILSVSFIYKIFIYIFR